MITLTLSGRGVRKPGDAPPLVYFAIIIIFSSCPPNFTLVLLGFWSKALVENMTFTVVDVFSF